MTLPGPPNPGRTRVAELDGMRGWAACSVVAYHLIWQIFGVAAPGVRNPLTAYLGKISFALYLTHFAILISATSLWIVFAGRHGGLNAESMGLIVVGSLALCIVVATLFEPVDGIAVHVSRVVVQRRPDLRRHVANMHSAAYGDEVTS